jgi:hypothetical protein
MLHGKHADCAVMKAAPIARNFREWCIYIYIYIYRNRDQLTVQLNLHVMTILLLLYITEIAVRHKKTKSLYEN